jgi:hypothetical protein
MKIRKTERGFQIIEFMDENAQSCTIQQSSLALYEKPGTSALWIGAHPNRMHLTDKQLKKIMPHLQAWLDTGSLKVKP